MCNLFSFEDVPAGPEIAGYYPRDEGRAGYRAVKDAEAIGASYDRYLRDGVIIVSLLLAC